MLEPETADFPEIKTVDFYSNTIFEKSAIKVVFVHSFIQEFLIGMTDLQRMRLHAPVNLFLLCQII